MALPTSTSHSDVEDYDVEHTIVGAPSAVRHEIHMPRRRPPTSTHRCSCDQGQTQQVQTLTTSYSPQRSARVANNPLLETKHATDSRILFFMICKDDPVCPAQYKLRAGQESSTPLLQRQAAIHSARCSRRRRRISHHVGVIFLQERPMADLITGAWANLGEPEGHAGGSGSSRSKVFTSAACKFHLQTCACRHCILLRIRACM